MTVSTETVIEGPKYNDGEHSGGKLAELSDGLS